MKIREATSSDISALAELARKTFIDAFGHSYAAAELQKRIEETRSEKYFGKALGKDTILVAEEDGFLLGYVEFGDLALNLEKATIGDQELSRLYVRAEHQRKGIGKALLEAALENTRLRNAKSVYLDVWEKNEGARKLYENYGFKETGEIIDGDIIMVRRQ